ncbi:aminotransferase class IV [soil metagenome]
MTTNPPDAPEGPRERGEAADPGKSAAEPGERRFLFRGGGFSPIAPLADDREHLLVADSWLVADGRVRAIDLHRERFVRSALESGYTNRTILDAFWAAIVEAIPPVHRWFPRAELSVVHAAPGSAEPRFQLSLRMRLAPKPISTAVLRNLGGGDPRSIPAVKGPDLHVLTALRNGARAEGIDDLVILADDGTIIDGTTTAVLWWRGGNLHLPPASLTRVDSVTARSIVVLARATGVAVIEEPAKPTDLFGAEVWAVNALHGIRAVTAWRDDAERPGAGGLRVDAARAGLWQRRLDSLAWPI